MLFARRACWWGAARWSSARARSLSSVGAGPAERATVLIDHIKKGDIDDARELVAEASALGTPAAAAGHLDLAMTDAYGSTALTLASRGGHLELTRALLALDPLPPILNAQNIFGSTALMCAAASGHERVTVELLEVAGVDVNVRTQYGSSALSKAAESGHAAIVSALLARGAVAHANKLGKGPAELAAAKGHAHVLPALELAAAAPGACALGPSADASARAAKPPVPSPPVRARVVGIRAGNVVCKLETAVQGPPSTVIAARAPGLPMAMPVNELVLLRRDMSVLPAGWLLIEVVPPDAGVTKAKQRCLHPRRPFDKKCVDCPDKRAGR
jgi:hypothetical protein